MEEKNKCIIDLFNLVDEITNKAKKHDMSLFKIASIGGCNMYQGCPPIKRIRDDIYNRHEKVINEAFRESK